MWILRYQYDLADGNTNKVSCCLKRGETYNIGRSSKNLLNVKNDKSISREHISISWENENNQLKLINQGKMTAASGKYLKIGESTNFSKSMGRALIELGTKPLKIQVQWLVCHWIIPYESLKAFEFLEGLGIELSSSDLKKANVIVTGEQPDYRKLLYGSAKEIPLMNSAFLDRLRLYFADNGTTFDSFWSEIMNDESLRYTSKHVPAQVLKDLEFFTIGKDEETSLAIEAAGGKYSSITNPEELQEISKNRESTDHIVIIKSPSMSSEQLMSRGKAFTMKDVVEAIYKGDLNSLKNGFPRDIIEKSKDEGQVERVAKKRRLNRPRVKPLDVLSFFAGGDSMKVSQESTARLDSQVKEPKEQERPNEPLRERLLESERQAEESKGESTAVLNPEIPNELIEKSKVDSEHRESRIRDEGACVEAVVEPARKIMKPLPQGTENAAPSPPITEKSKSIPTRRKSTLHYENTDAPSENEMVQIIQDTKNREVRRLNSTIIQIGDEELTEDAINQLGNLVLVDQNDRLLRRRDRTQAILDIPNPDWNNRKNFKNFVKVLPKYRGLKDAHQEGSSDTIRRRAFLLTREYVSTKTYSANDSSRKVQDNIQGNLYDSPRLESGGQLEPRVETPISNNLFVMDEEDSEDIVLEEPSRALAPSLSQIISEKHIDSDSDDDEPKFEFKRHR